MNPAAGQPAPPQPMIRAILLLSGWFCFCLGFAGIFLPLLPTTIFWILAAWCWMRSSPRLAKRLLDHPRFGAAIGNFLHHGQVSRRGKNYAALGIAAGYLLWLCSSSASVTTVTLVSCGFATLVGWISTRPEPTHCV